MTVRDLFPSLAEWEGFMDNVAPRLGKVIWAIGLDKVYAVEKLGPERIDMVDGYSSPLYVYLSLPAPAGLICLGRDERGQTEFARKEDEEMLLGISLFLNGVHLQPPPMSEFFGQSEPLLEKDGKSCRFLPGCAATYSIKKDFVEAVFCLSPEDADWEIADDLPLVKLFYEGMGDVAEIQQEQVFGLERGKVLGRRGNSVFAAGGAQGGGADGRPDSGAGGRAGVDAALKERRERTGSKKRVLLTAEELLGRGRSSSEADGNEKSEKTVLDHVTLEINVVLAKPSLLSCRAVLGGTIRLELVPRFMTEFRRRRRVILEQKAVSRECMYPRREGMPRKMLNEPGAYELEVLKGKWRRDAEKRDRKEQKRDLREAEEAEKLRKEEEEKGKKKKGWF